MNLSAWFDASSCVRLTLTLGHFLWQGMAIALLAGLIVLALRRASAQARYGVLVVALVLMATCVPMTFCMIAVPAPARPEPDRPADVLTSVDAASEVAPLPERLEALLPPREPFETVDVPPPVIASAEPVASPATAPRRFDWLQLAPLATAVYLVGVLLLLARLLLGLHGGRRLCRRSQPVEDAGILGTLARQATALGLRFMPAVAFCRQVAVPTVVGVLRPTILLPLALATGLTPDQVEAILTHELAHIRRYDHLVNLLQRLVEAFLFFHPAVWWLSRQIRLEREHCCDDLVVSLGATPLHYAESLLQVAELSQSQRGSEPVPGIVGLYATTRPSRLRQRIARLLGGPAEPHMRFGRGWTLTLAIMLVSAVSTAVVMMLRAEPPPADQTVDDTAEPVNAEPQAASEPTSQLGPFQPVATLGDGRLRHWNYIHAIAYSPDGTRIATASRDHTVTVWDVATGRACWTGIGAGSVNCVAFSPDGKTLASGGEVRVLRGDGIQIVRGKSRLFTSDVQYTTGAVKLWDVETAKELFALNTHVGGGSATSVAFSPDGRTLAAGCGEIELWDAATGQELRTLTGHSKDYQSWAVYGLAFSPDGQTLASGATDHLIKLWDVATGQERRTLSQHVMPVWSLVFSRDGKTLLSGSDDHQLKMWNPDNGAVFRQWQIGRAKFLSLSADQKTVISGDRDCVIRVTNLETGKEERKIELGPGFIPAYALSPDGKTLAWSNSETVRLLDV